MFLADTAIVVVSSIFYITWHAIVHYIFFFWIAWKNFYRIHAFFVTGGLSIGCPGNSGAAGTYFNANLLSLKVSNDNVSTETETPLLDFSTTPLWSNVYVENNAKVLVPLVWSRVQVGKLYTLCTMTNIHDHMSPFYNFFCTFFLNSYSGHILHPIKSFTRD